MIFKRTLFSEANSWFTSCATFAVCLFFSHIMFLCFDIEKHPHDFHNLQVEKLLLVEFCIVFKQNCIPERSAKIHVFGCLNPQIPSSHPGNKSCCVSFVFDSLLVPKREVGLVSGMSEWNTKHWTPRHNSYLSSSSFNDHHHCYPQLLALMMIIPFPVWAAGRGTLSMWVNNYWAPAILSLI